MKRLLVASILAFCVSCSNHISKPPSSLSLKIIKDKIKIIGDTHQITAELEVTNNKDDLYIIASNNNMQIRLRNTTLLNLNNPIQIKEEDFYYTENKKKYYLPLEYTVSKKEKQDNKNITIKLNIINESDNVLASEDITLNISNQIQEIADMADVELSIESLKYIENKYNKNSKPDIKSQIKEIQDIKNKIANDLEKKELIDIANSIISSTNNSIRILNQALKKEQFIPQVLVDKIKKSYNNLNKEKVLLESVIKALNDDVSMIDDPILGEKLKELIIKKQQLEGGRKEVGETIKIIIRSSITTIVIALAITPFIAMIV